MLVYLLIDRGQLILLQTEQVCGVLDVFALKDTDWRLRTVMSLATLGSSVLRCGLLESSFDGLIEIFELGAQLLIDSKQLFNLLVLKTVIF